MLIPTVLAGSMGMNAIVQAQNIWFVFLAPLAAIIFMIAAIAELGRSPFDMNEAESEIVAGFHIEYTGMKFGLFYAGELLHAFTFGGFWAILFFGGYRFLGLENLGPLVAAAILIAKAMLGYWFIMWVRYTVMRIRIDHMLAFNWKFLTPLAFVLLMVTALLNAWLRDTPWFLYIAGMLAGNLVLGLVVAQVLRNYSRRERAKIEGPAQPATVSQ
jgi:NADH-quinone oxidoreductase subunit H